MSNSRICLACFIVIGISCHIRYGERMAIGAEEPNDPFQARTVWKGESLFEKNEYLLEPKPLTMVLYINERKGVHFEGMTWYPEGTNRLVKVTGEVCKNGRITFIEQDLIHDDSGSPRVAAGMKFVGQLVKTSLKGSGEWTGPAFNGPVRLTFTLKLAE